MLDVLDGFKENGMKMESRNDQQKIPDEVYSVNMQITLQHDSF